AACPGMAAPQTPPASGAAGTEVNGPSSTDVNRETDCTPSGSDTRTCTPAAAPGAGTTGQWLISANAGPAFGTRCAFSAPGVPPVAGCGSTVCLASRLIYSRVCSRGLPLSHLARNEIRYSREEEIFANVSPSLSDVHAWLCMCSVAALAVRRRTLLP